MFLFTDRLLGAPGESGRVYCPTSDDVSMGNTPHTADLECCVGEGTCGTDAAKVDESKEEH